MQSRPRKCPLCFVWLHRGGGGCNIWMIHTGPVMVWQSEVFLWPLCRFNQKPCHVCLVHLVLVFKIFFHAILVDFWGHDTYSIHDTYSLPWKVGQPACETLRGGRRKEMKWSSCFRRKQVSLKDKAWIETSMCMRIMESITQRNDLLWKYHLVHALLWFYCCFSIQSKSPKLILFLNGKGT